MTHNQPFHQSLEYATNIQCYLGIAKETMKLISICNAGDSSQKTQ